MPTAEEAAAANAAYRAANGYPVDPNNTRILSTPEGQAYLQNQQRKAAADDAYLDQQKHDRAFSQPRNDNDVPRSAAFLAINAEYAASRNRVTTSGGSVYQGAVSNNVNPYAENTAAGIAWDVAKTGGATDLRLNVIATQQIASVGGDASFIRYATDIYIERPSYPQETLTTRDGQTFVNPEWSGVPIRANLTVAEMREGLNPSGKYYQYNQETHMLDKFTGNIPVDPGVHTKFGDFGGPILQRDGSYGGWTPNGGNGRLVGGGKVAAFGERIDATSPQNVEVLMAGGALPKPFRAGGNVTTISKPSERWETGIPLIGGFIPAGIFNPTSQVRDPGRAFVSWIAPTETTTITSFGETTIDRSDMPKMAGAEATMMFIGADNKPTSILTEKTGAPYEKGGQIFQDYTTTDISKVTMSQSSSITTVGNSPAGTMLEGWNAKASSAMGLPTVSNEQIKESGWVAGLIPGGVPFAIALKTPILGDYTASYLQGEYTGFRTRPIDTIAFTGVGMAMGGDYKKCWNHICPGAGRYGRTRHCFSWGQTCNAI